MWVFILVCVYVCGTGEEKQRNTYKDEHPHYSIISENFLERQFSYTKEELEGFIPLRKEGGSVHDAL